MPIVIVLILLWVGTLLDMASTYLTVVVIGGEFREVNQFYLAANGDFSLVNLLTINGVFLLVFSLTTMLALRNRNMVNKYIRETGLGVHAKEASISKNYRVTVSIGWPVVFSKEELPSKNYVRTEDFVSHKVIGSVSTLVLIGSVGGARFLCFVNNLTEYYGYPGFMSLFLWAFRALHEQLALYIVFAIAVVALYPITYLLLRLTARACQHLVAYRR